MAEHLLPREKMVLRESWGKYVAIQEAPWFGFASRLIPGVKREVCIRGANAACRGVGVGPGGDVHGVHISARW